jgi:ribonuclease BN (tRNA processing enzyme)
VVLLGTGTPIPDPDRSGPATAIVVGDSAYLVDFGTGGLRSPAEVLQEQISSRYSGQFVIGRDLDVY